jgi:hypothetical protein
MKERSASERPQVAQRTPEVEPNAQQSTPSTHADPALAERQARALLDLVEADRERQCTQILGEAGSRAAALRAQSQAEAHARMRQAFAEQRLLQRSRIAAAQARLATHRRLHEQQRSAALLRLAGEQLPGELLALWRQGASRALWVDHVIAAAKERMPHGPWHIVHAADWPPSEQQALAQTIAAESGAAPLFEPEATIGAGLKIVADGNLIDGTLDGLLSDRDDIEARLLRYLEGVT